MIVTLTGLNSFGLKNELKKLVADFIDKYGDLSVERLDGEETETARLRESVASLPFLTPRKLVILRDPSRQKRFAEDIKDILKEAAETTDLIIIEPKLDKRLSYYKTLRSGTDFREFNELDASGLAQWASGYAQERGGNLKSSEARLLIDRVGANQQLVASEIDKLLAFDPQISPATIELLVDPLPQSTIFELLDAAFAGKTKRALELYHEQRALKIEPQAIIAMLAWQLHGMALVKTGASHSVEEIARQAKLNPFVVRKTMAIVRELNLDQLKNLIQDLLTLDLSSKTTGIDLDEALELYLLKLT